MPPPAWEIAESPGCQQSPGALTQLAPAPQSFGQKALVQAASLEPSSEQGQGRACGHREPAQH